MSKHSAPITPAARKGTLGDRIRTIADQLNQESAVQIKATSRILGAAAKISENHDRLLDEVVEMVEEDLDQQVQMLPAEPHVKAHTVEKLKQRFKTLNSAKAYFNLKASGWAALAAKLNNRADDSASPTVNDAHDAKDSILYRLEAIEHEIRSMRIDLAQALKFLDILLKKL